MLFISLFVGWGDLNMRVVSMIQYGIHFLCLWGVCQVRETPMLLGIIINMKSEKW